MARISVHVAYRTLPHQEISPLRALPRAIYRTIDFSHSNECTALRSSPHLAQLLILPQVDKAVLSIGLDML